ncbi:MAG TPA: 3,4-dihydroxyphenylacetate 2,3-dioxygenase [Solirubrobacteraceae bacterium]|jgi:3,4-dihydroxyphenylacetate 2,3-dioxygenase|nr:3,4-dihydroxyphenylacetate 2,3-dioxygenase [Solirubrobacteraceae bacterium]
MTSATELVQTAPANPGFDIIRAARVELLVTDLAASEHFYADLLGMIVSARTDDAVYLRAWEERQHHSLVLRRAPHAAASRLGFRVRHEEDLDRLAVFAQEHDLTVCWSEAGAEPGLGPSLMLWDPFGYPLEFFHEIEQFETQHQRFDLHRGAPLLRFDHLNLHTPNVEQAFRWWLALGFKCSEYISTDNPVDERITGAWMLRKPTVHDLALTAGTGPRLHHFAYWVGEPAGVMRACDQLSGANQVEVIERGPGRHGVSNAFFVYLRDPDGHRIELYSCDYYTGDPDHKPLRWSVTDPRCRSFWGTAAPDSWYEESSFVVGPDGDLIDTQAAGVDERDQRSQVLA